MANPRHIGSSIAMNLEWGLENPYNSTLYILTDAKKKTLIVTHHLFIETVNRNVTERERE
jgi:hypothetical protein